MSTWQENLTWQSNLLDEIPVSRWSTIRCSNLVTILVFQKRSASPPHPGNLELRQILRESGGDIQKSILNDSERLFCVAVHMGTHILPVDCSFTTQDMVAGSVSIHVSFRVSNPKTFVIGTYDPLALLSTRCREAIVDLTEQLAFANISTRQIRNIVENVETHDLGLVITNASIPAPITWPSDIVEPRRDIPRIQGDAGRDKIVQETAVEQEKELARLLREKIESMGISHPAALMRVLSRHGADYQVILEAAQHASDEWRSGEEQAGKLLLWLIENDRVPRAALDDLVETLSGRVTADMESLPDTDLSVLTAPSPSDSLLSSPMKHEGKDDKPNASEQGSSKPKETGSLSSSSTEHEKKDERTYATEKDSSKPKDALFSQIEAKQDAFRKKYRISIAHPKLLSKRYSSRFLIQIYLPEMRRQVSRKLKKQFEGQKIAEHTYNSELETGLEVKLKLFSPGIFFSEPVHRKLGKGIISTNFIAKPGDNCHPGNHQVILSISDVETQFEYQSISFTVKVTDFAFDHVSRPILSKVSTIAMSAGSLIMFILTLLGKIDTTFGLTSGTVAGMLASVVYARFVSFYYQQKVTISRPTPR